MHIFKTLPNYYLPPWSVKFNKKVLMLLEFLIEGVVSEYKDSLLCFDGGDGGHNVGCCEHEK